ncbi:hypothetical protein L1987_80939 [Smallanthus sonchifolius]|uniref:Uncharacterized protein n=1 Tax=Smallanthus sonchifolius TaxID=185202 RepID=A0ACB8YP21_9ASTR|nr:hypothetical protein L1987_80939 [Smallanthus sonchifolius]
MVGLFSRFSVSRNGHRRSQTTLDEREVLPPEVIESSTIVGATATTTHHGLEVAIEFKPADHLTEPLDPDQPIHCPLPEPSILNDGRIWKERVQTRRDSSLVQEGVGAPPEPEAAGPKSQRRTNRVILPSISAPEHNILKLLEECNASGM